MKKRRVLITGANGGIGQALCSTFSDHGWHVISTDRHDNPTVAVDQYFPLDLERFADDEAFRRHAESILFELLPECLDCLINNAAYQVVAPVDKITVQEWQRSINVNLTAPFLLVRALLERLAVARGSVINVTSIHARLTKSGFSAYSTSKAALEGLTRALAVELGSRVRVNGIAPSAIATHMLEAGFRDSPKEFDALASHHPSAQIGSPDEVARLAVFIAQESSSFLNGSIIGMDGGIASRLHDPA